MFKGTKVFDAFFQCGWCGKKYRVGVGPWKGNDYEDAKMLRDQHEKSCLRRPKYMDKINNDRSEPA